MVEVFNTEQLAAYLGISKHTVYRKINEISHFKVFGTYRFRKENVDKWAEEQLEREVDV